jgi:hypothetical protein
MICKFGGVGGKIAFQDGNVQNFTKEVGHAVHDFIKKRESERDTTST